MFRSLQEAGCLAEFANSITGDESGVEPFLYLWGIGVSDESFEPWNLLTEARRRFESNLPVDRPLTEPDIGLHLPGRYLILIEAKFTSFNSFYLRGPRKDARSLTLEELLGIYRDRRLIYLDAVQADRAPRVPYQLWRNTVFAEWMAAADHTGTKAYFVNLVREGYETETEEEFRRLIRPEFQNRFRRITWERLYRQFDNSALLRLKAYIEHKSAGLRQAFRIEAPK